MSLFRRINVLDSLGALINPATKENQTAILANQDDIILRLQDFYLQVKRGNILGHSIVSKFGSANVSTALIPVTTSLTYQTPTAATALEAISTSANDTAAGTGGQQLTVVGLSSAWQEVSQTVEMNGLTAVALTTDLTRMYRYWVSRSGTYATAAAGSHAGAITIQGAGAGPVWGTIPVSPFAFGQSQIGVYTIPIGYTGYLINKNIFAEGSKTADVYFYHRDNANDVTTPYTGIMRSAEREIGVTGGYSSRFLPKGPYVGPCDVGFMAIVASGIDVVSVEFDILLIQDGY